MLESRINSHGPLQPTPEGPTCRIVPAGLSPDGFRKAWTVPPLRALHRLGGLHPMTSVALVAVGVRILLARRQNDLEV